jgi:hypothetical protein
VLSQVQGESRGQSGNDGGCSMHGLIKGVTYLMVAFLTKNLVMK